MTFGDLASRLALLATWVLGVLGITVDDSLSSEIKSVIVGAIAAVTIAHRVLSHLDKRHANNAAVQITQAKTAASVPLFNQVAADIMSTVHTLFRDHMIDHHPSAPPEPPPAHVAELIGEGADVTIPTAGPELTAPPATSTLATS